MSDVQSYRPWRGEAVIRGGVALLRVLPHARLAAELPRADPPQPWPNRLPPAHRVVLGEPAVEISEIHFDAQVPLTLFFSFERATHYRI